MTAPVPPPDADKPLWSFRYSRNKEGDTSPGWWAIEPRSWDEAVKLRERVLAVSDLGADLGVWCSPVQRIDETPYVYDAEGCAWKQDVASLKSVPGMEGHAPTTATIPEAVHYLLRFLNKELPNAKLSVKAPEGGFAYWRIAVQDLNLRVRIQYWPDSWDYRVEPSSFCPPEFIKKIEALSFYWARECYLSPKVEAESKPLEATKRTSGFYLERIARAIFETDPRVFDFVAKVSEPGQSRYFDAKRWSRAMQIAWERDEKGWRTEALQRARALHAWLTANPPKD